MRAALAVCLLAGCAPAPTPSSPTTSAPATAAGDPTALAADVTPAPTREVIEPGTRLPYVTQTGDTLAAIAVHFNTTTEEVLAVNPGLPAQAVLPAGQALQVPAYYFPFGGPTFRILPDSAFVYGPASSDLEVAAYLQTQPGYLRALSAYAAQRQRTSADTVLFVAQQYSISPRLLLALLEWRGGALSQSEAPPEVIENPLGLADGPPGFYLQLLWAAEQLSLGYYGWRSGALTQITLSDGYRSRVDMYQNAATVGIQFLLSQLLPRDQFEAAAGPDGFAAAYRRLWGDPWAAGAASEVLSAGLSQPELLLPFEPGQEWALTGGPHAGWGTDLPWSAVDFAPPAGETGCITTEKWVTAAAPGIIARSADNTVVLDLDGDGREQTGWVLFHFHMADRDIVAPGTVVKAGDRLGHPSCEGGRATGTHVHIARRYNGEWIPADGVVPGVVPFVLGGWEAQRGGAAYQGRLTRLGAWVEACTCSTALNRIYWVQP